MKKMLKSLLFVTALFTYFSAAQAADTYATGDNYFASLGLQPGFDSTFDQLTVTGLSGNITAPLGNYQIASLSFAAGYNAWTPLDSSGNLNLIFSINGTPGTLALPYLIHIDTVDTLTLNPGNLSMTSGGNMVNVSTQKVIFSGVDRVDLYGPRQANLMASISVTPVPEPETYAMMLAGLGLMGFIARRRKQR